MAARAAADATAEEETTWLGLAFSFAANLVAPEEEEGIHQLTESITRKSITAHPLTNPLRDYRACSCKNASWVSFAGDMLGHFGRESL